MRLALSFVLAAAFVTACGTNPVTGKREIQFVSEAQEVQLGEQNYAPAQQSQGGDFDLLPELTSYVSSVGQKLAAVADRKLPYEFVVLDNSVPNAWALPGGKIAVNRGLLTALDNESELAAVLGHEIVHAAARHGAKAQERGTLMQAGMAIAQIGAAVGGVDQNLAGLVLQGAGVGAQMVQMKYSREQELEADQYGMRYMKRAGYDPTGAVTLQEKFVKIANEGEHKQSWLDGLFASHPPSTERVKQNQALLAELGAGGQVGAKEYLAHVQPLMKMEPAFDKYDAAIVAANKKDFDTARTLANEAVQLVPKEGLFHQLVGDIAMAQKKPAEALPHYQQAIDRNPDYFGSYLGAGIAKLQLGDRAQAEQWLQKSVDLLPTAPAAYYLGTIAKEKGDQSHALEYFKAAASSDSRFGQMAGSELVRMDLPQNPGNYIATAAQLDPSGRLILVVENRAPVPLSSIQVTPVLIDDFGRVVREGSPVVIREVLNPNQRIAGDAGVGAVTPQQLSQVRFRVDGARVAE
ncbi:MAG TPA: M48 family metalloprotease [Steroidobacteraceae bacterium]|nr:M48 family metalloprotease [Steroidobacteraceae bacterium]